MGTDIASGEQANQRRRQTGLLTNGPATDHYRVLTASKDWRFGAISRADVADFLVRQINDRALIGTTPLLIS